MSEQTPNRMTLTDYIDKNDKLLTVLAVFTGLAAFANELKTDSARFLSFLFLTLAVLIWFEVYRTFPAEVMISKKGRLYWFGEVLFLSMIAFIWYWIEEFHPFLLIPVLMLVALIPIVLTFAGLATFYDWLLKKNSYFQQHEKRRADFTLIATMVTIATLFAGWKMRHQVVSFWDGLLP